MKPLILALGIIVMPSLGLAQARPATPPKLTIKVIFRLDAQGPEGQWSQVGEDLSAAQLSELRAAIRKELAALPNHRLVGPDEKDDCIGLAVVAEKLDSGRDSYILMSSAVTIAKGNGTDEFVTHDVIAEPTIGRAAHAVVGQLVGSELRALAALR